MLVEIYITRKLKPYTPIMLETCIKVSENDKVYPSKFHGKPVNIHDLTHSINTQYRQNIN